MRNGRPSARRTVRSVFDRASRVYDTELLQRVAYRPAQDEVVGRLRSAGVRRVVDAGCGTGILAARIDGELRPEMVIGCDFSAGMLGQATARSTSVCWLQADAGRLPLRSEGVDAVVSTQAFHFFDQDAALAEFHRVLVAGGLLAVAMINPRSLGGSRRLSRLATRFLGGGYWPTQEEMRRRVEAAGFEVRHQGLVGRLGRLVPVMTTVARKRQ